MKYIIVITGASSGFGVLAARALAAAGHTVYASMRETKRRDAPQVKELQEYAAEHAIDLRPIELDVSSEKSCEAAIQEIISKNGRLDVVVHNAGHMVFGPAEAFTREQTRGVVRRQCAEHTACEPRVLTSIAQAGERSPGVGVEQ